jgi:hypothetical protein
MGLRRRTLPLPVARGSPSNAATSAAAAEVVDAAAGVAGVDGDSGKSDCDRFLWWFGVLCFKSEEPESGVDEPLTSSIRASKQVVCMI